MLPYLEAITMNQTDRISGECFKTLNWLTELQILSPSVCKPDTILNSKTIRDLKKLEMLHVMNNTLTDDDFYFMRNLRVLVIISDKVTPRILNYLPNLELCIINKKLCKYISSAKNKQILKRIGRLASVKIYAIENSQHL
jgi:hypothetical protein